MPSGRVVVIDDHAIFSSLIGDALGDLGYVAVIGDPLEQSDDELLGLADGDDPCLVVLDLALGPGHAPFELIERLVGRGNAVVVLTASDDPAVHELAMASGAAAVVEKVGSLDHFADVLGAVATGMPASAPGRPRSEAPGFDQLTPREGAVLAALVQGRAPKDIASELAVALPTVRTQIRSIYRKLQVNNQRAAILLAVEAGWNTHAER